MLALLSLSLCWWEGLEARGKRKGVVLLLVVRGNGRRRETTVLDGRLLKRTGGKDPLGNSLLKPLSYVGAAAHSRCHTGGYGHMRVVLLTFEGVSSGRGGLLRSVEGFQGSYEVWVEGIWWWGLLEKGLGLTKEWLKVKSDEKRSFWQFLTFLGHCNSSCWS